MSHSLALNYRSLEAFFFEEIEQVQAQQLQPLPLEVEAYVVHLLARYARRTHAAGRASRPLALEYMRAKSESGKAKAHALRNVGDRALYIASVVPRSLERTPVNVRYVKTIGESAYREVAGAGPLAVLGLLAEMFDAVAEVIGEVVDLAKRNDLLSVYERWRRTDDPAARKRLVQAGVFVGELPNDVQ